jgi:hypothetical protein
MEGVNGVESVYVFGGEWGSSPPQKREYTFPSASASKSTLVVSALISLLSLLKIILGPSKFLGCTRSAPPTPCSSLIAPRLLSLEASPVRTRSESTIESSASVTVGSESSDEAVDVVEMLDAEGVRWWYVTGIVVDGVTKDGNA